MARSGEFRLYERAELPEGWSPTADARLTVWEAVQHLVLALGGRRRGGGAAAPTRRLRGTVRGNSPTCCSPRRATTTGRPEAGVYNGLITAWPALRSADVIVDTPLFSLKTRGGGGFHA